MSEPVQQPARHVCPMCGRIIASSKTICSYCGEPPVEKRISGALIDKCLAYITGGVGATICIFFLVNLEPGLNVIVAGLVFGLLFGPPWVRVSINSPKPGEKPAISLWRIFWQTQAVMYAITLGSFVLCLGVCTPSSFH